MKEKIKKLIKEITLEKTIKLSIVLVVLMIGFSVFWSFVITPYKNRKNVDNCLEKAYEKQNTNWKEYCRIDEREIGEDGSCLLSSERADHLYKIYKDKKDECFKKYPVK